MFQKTPGTKRDRAGIIKFFFPFILFMCFLGRGSTSALALSDADYNKYMKESPNFAQADKSLGQAWRAVKKAYGGNVPEELKDEQRQWIQSTRDTEANALLDKMSPAEAYATVTGNRAQILQAKWLRQAKQNTPTNRGADITGEYWGYSKGKYYDNSNVSVKKLSQGEYAVDIGVAGAPDSGINGWCSFKGKAKLQNTILKAAAVSDFDGKKYTLSIFFKGNNTIEIKDPHETLRRDFCAGPDMLDGTYKKK